MPRMFRHLFAIISLAFIAWMATAGCLQGHKANGIDQDMDRLVSMQAESPSHQIIVDTSTAAEDNSEESRQAEPEEEPALAGQGNTYSLLVAQLVKCRMDKAEKTTDFAVSVYRPPITLAA